MLKVPEKDYDVGCIVARFQVDELHEAHKQLIEFVSNRHKKIIILLGVSPTPNSRKNPLPFVARQQMLKELYPDATIVPIKGFLDDTVWSKNLDSTIKDLITLQQTVVLYGSRSSFIASYTGSFDTVELESDIYVSGSEVRKEISKDTHYDRSWRRGAIWAAYNRYPTSYQAVDAAIFNEDETKLLMVRKPGEDKYRFCGGFVDPKTKNLETNCRREIQEELHIEVSDPKYIGSTNVDDWRYKDEVDGVMTCIFKCKFVFGTPTPDDDICEAKWISIKDLNELTIMPTHLPLVKIVKESIQ